MDQASLFPRHLFWLQINLLLQGKHYLGYEKHDPDFSKIDFVDYVVGPKEPQLFWVQATLEWAIDFTE